ncbi:MAG: hypothetical protein CFE45_37495 [Burkholderiales bacterium PBB5]|nr:MAG: hypothetical protein CFE45_37495 [Burkholderiales bacterium PBB5]
MLRYDARQRGQRRAIGLQRQGGDALLHAFVLAGDVRAEAWIKALLVQQLPAQAYGRQLLRPAAVAPVALATTGRQVCTCLNVGEATIRSTLAVCSGGASQRLAGLQQALGCGTQCGSCLPELRRLVQDSVPAVA